MKKEKIKLKLNEIVQLLKEKKNPIVMTVLLSFVLFTYHNCGEAEYAAVVQNTAQWSNPILVENDNISSADNPKLAFLSSGLIMAAWSQGDNIVASLFNGREWSQSRIIGRQIGSTFQLIALKNEGVAIIWNSSYDSNHYIGISIFKNSEWSEARLLPGKGANISNMVAMEDQSENIVVAWTENGLYGGLYSSVFSSNNWENVSTLRAGSPAQMQIAFNIHRDAMIMWTEGTSLWASSFRNRIWSTASKIENLMSGSHPKITMKDNGDVMAIWERGGTNGIAFSLFRDSEWGSPQLIAPSGWQVTGLNLVLDSSDTFIASWKSFPDCGIWVSHFKNDTWETANNLIQEKSSGCSIASSSGVVAPAVEMMPDKNGNTYVFFSNMGTEENKYISDLWISHYVDKSWGKPILLENNNLGSVYAHSLDSVLNHNGSRGVIWTQNDGIRNNIWFSFLWKEEILSPQNISNEITGIDNEIAVLRTLPKIVGGRSFTQTTLAELQRITSQLRCQTGSSRVRVDFYTQNVGQNSTTVQGPFTKGALPGTPSAEFIGISRFGDIMVVSKVTSGSQIAHNVSLFFCPATNQYTGTEVIGASTTLDGFAVDQIGIILDSNTNCASGNVERAYTGIKSSGHMNGQQYIETSFTPYCQ